MALQFQFHSHTSRRTSLALYSVSILSFQEAIFDGGTANAFDFGVTAPDQTVEEAEDVIKGHAQSLLRVKDLLEPDTLKEAQKALRKSSSYLKQDLYTIIQAKPGSARPQLRKLYSILFNSVTRLDYAARDKDVTRVRECYDNIVLALDEILSRL
ncbi:hypothetical protein RJ639_038167 [Escallonia herrerae]|uniref:PQL-like protein n=1 Tax=Escallonia herrerae TaxID=1293975 RepID=A0AA89B593_9ASTE|nr:hypothetical protein RJ639_038167 [Escallonia herrerae]